MRYLFALLISIIAFTACKDRVICPAFQSTYILDDSVRMTYYSYLWKLDEAERTKYLAQKASSTSIAPTLASNETAIADSSAVMMPDSTGVLTASISGTPAPAKKDYFAYTADYKVEEREVKKTKYGIIKYEPYWLKNYRMRTAPMENVLAPKDEKLPPGLEEDTTSVEEGEFYASDFGDSLAIDSTAVAANIETDTTEEFVLPTLARAPPPEPEPEPEYLYRYDPKDKMLNMEQDYYNKYFGQYLIKQPKKKKEPEVPKPALSDSTDTGQSDGLVPSEDGASNFTEGEEEPLSKKELKRRRKAEKAARKAAEAEAEEEETPAFIEPEDAPEPQEETPAEEEEQEQGGGDMGF